MEKTQLQLRIETQAATQRTFPIQTYFIDLQGYQDTPFLDAGHEITRYISEEQVKTNKEAVQARLAHMEFGREYVDIINEYVNSKNKFFGGLKRKLKLTKIKWRNIDLMQKAINKALEEKGGLVRLMLEDKIGVIISQAATNKSHSNNF